MALIQALKNALLDPIKFANYAFAQRKKRRKNQTSGSFSQTFIRSSISRPNTIRANDFTDMKNVLFKSTKIPKGLGRQNEIKVQLTKSNSRDQRNFLRLCHYLSELYLLPCRISDFQVYKHSLIVHIDLNAQGIYSMCRW